MKIYSSQFGSGQTSDRQQQVAIWPNKTCPTQSSSEWAQADGKTFGRLGRTGKGARVISNPIKTLPNLGGMKAASFVLFWIGFGWLFAILAVSRYAHRLFASCRRFEKPA